MSGGPDPLYIAARRTLLDALEVMKDHLDAVILVGAQAVYLHTGAGELAVDPYTTDADLALDPTLFETLRSTGCLMAARAAAPLESEEVVAASAVALSHDLVKALKRLRE